MTTVKKAICILLIIFVFHSCVKKKIVEVCSGFQDKIYEYSIYHCTEADSLDCSQKVEKSLQLPDQYLRCSSTDSLSQTCLNYPFFGYIWAYSSIQEGFERVKDMFNGIDELFSREGANSSLIRIYQRMHPEDVNDIPDPVDRGAFMARFTFIEITLAQYQLIQKLNNDQRITLISICFDKYNSKTSIPSYSWIGSMSTLAIIARILYTEDYKPFVNLMSANQDLEYFVQNADFDNMSPDIINDITQIVLSTANNYISGLKQSA